MSDEIDREEVPFGEDPLSLLGRKKNAVESHREKDVLRENDGLEAGDGLEGDDEPEGDDGVQKKGQVQNEALDQRLSSEDKIAQKRTSTLANVAAGDQFGNSSRQQSHRIGAFLLSMSVFSDDEDYNGGDEQDDDQGKDEHQQSHKPNARRGGNKSGVELRFILSGAEPSPASQRKGDKASRDDKAQTQDSHNAFGEANESGDKGTGNDRAPKTEKKDREQKKADFEITINLGDHKPKPKQTTFAGMPLEYENKGKGWNFSSENTLDVGAGATKLMNKIKSKFKGPGKSGSKKGAESKDSVGSKPSAGSKHGSDIEMTEIKKK